MNKPGSFSSLFEEGIFIERTRSLNRGSRPQQSQSQILHLDIRAVSHLRVHYIEQLQMELRERTVVDVARFSTISAMRSVTITPILFSWTPKHITSRNPIAHTENKVIQELSNEHNSSSPMALKNDIEKFSAPVKTNEEDSKLMDCGKSAPIHSRPPKNLKLLLVTPKQLKDEIEVERGECTFLYRSASLNGTHLQEKQSPANGIAVSRDIKPPTDCLEPDDSSCLEVERGEERIAMKIKKLIKPKSISSSAESSNTTDTTLEKNPVSKSVAAGATFAAVAAPKHVTFSREVSFEDTRTQPRQLPSHMIHRTSAVQMSEVELNECRTWNELLPVSRATYLKQVTFFTSSFVRASCVIQPNKLQDVHKNSTGTVTMQKDGQQQCRPLVKEVLNGKPKNRSSSNKLNGVLEKKASRKSKNQHYVVSLTVLLDDFRTDSKLQMPTKRSEFRTFIICSS